MEVGPTLERLLKEYEGKIKLVVKFMPYKYRDYARIAAEAACFAYKEGVFPQMHELLLKNSPALDIESLIKYGARIGLDPAKMKEAVERGECSGLIERDLRLASELNVYGTPTFFVGKKRLTGVHEYELLKSILGTELGGQEK